MKVRLVKFITTAQTFQDRRLIQIFPQGGEGFGDYAKVAGSGVTGDLLAPLY